ncbi:MAG: hypothetical protein IPQ18_14635 [Saprospiraceae bacterium]|nr:hypothetical protein [Saprospiraceae bacterium]
MKGTDLNAIAGIFSDSLEVLKMFHLSSSFLPDGSFEPVLTGKVFRAKQVQLLVRLPVCQECLWQLTAKTPAITEAGALCKK